jgi:hypothetical protein
MASYAYKNKKYISYINTYMQITFYPKAVCNWLQFSLKLHTLDKTVPVQSSKCSVQAHQCRLCKRMT